MTVPGADRATRGGGPRLRADLVDQEPYLAPQVDAPVPLNTNECPYPLPPAFTRHLEKELARIEFNRYPDREVLELRTRLADHTGHPVEGVWAANGSNEIIQQLCLAYGGPGRRALVFQPTFHLHSLIPRVTGMEVVAERLGRGFALGPEAAGACARHRPDVTFVCSPNNPTGNAQSLDEVAAVCRETGAGLVIVDEAYGEFGGESAVALLPHHPNLVVTRTFSKAFALAAARIGYCLADPGVIAGLARVRLPYHLSAMSQVAGVVALRYAGDAAAILDRVRSQRDRLVERLARIDGVEAFRSDANFVLFRTGREGRALWSALVDRGVLVRDVSAGPGLERCLRVTAGTPEETDAFLAALPGAVEAAA
ncbi:MAG: histidinol-phosphate transaminase [Actinomycetota bacterium]